MDQRYTIRQDDDRSWSVVLDGTDEPLRLAGRPQTQLTRAEAEVTLELLSACQPQGAKPPSDRDAANRIRHRAA